LNSLMIKEKKINVKITILTVLILLIFIIPALAIGGYISLDYNTMQENWVSQVRIYQDFNKLRIGYHATTDLFEISLKDGYFPAGVPLAQYYGLFVNYEIVDGISLRLNEWCNHWFAQSGQSWRRDSQDITVGIKIDFQNYFTKED